MADQDNKNLIKASPKATWIWLIIFIGLGVLLMFKNCDSEKITEFNQTQFVEALKENRILTADINSEANDVLSISGRYRLNADATATPVKETTSTKNPPRS